MMTSDLSRRALIGAGAAFLAAPAIAQTNRLRPRVAAPAPLSAEDQALVARAVDYLQGLSTARGRFTQTDPRGSVTQGTLYLQRPGKARFAYDAPSRLVVVSNGSTVNVWDGRLRSFQSYPLGATPLSLFLARNIRLDRGVIVDRVTRLTDAFEITARDARRQAEGRIILRFTNAPTLSGWTIVDGRGASTRVSISELQTASGLDPNLFVLRDPRPRPGGARP
jgi:outer membrane lipoprotein-sorting protein